MALKERAKDLEVELEEVLDSDAPEAMSETEGFVSDLVVAPAVGFRQADVPGGTVLAAAGVAELEDY